MNLNQNNNFGNVNNNNKDNNNSVVAFVEFLNIIYGYVLYTIRRFFRAYYACRKNKRNTSNALQFELNYADNLVLLWKDVNNRTYEIGKSICFIVTKPKIREVFAADFRDRIVHHIIMDRLEPLFEAHFIEDNYNCRKNKGTLYGINRLYEQIKECSNDYTKDCWVGKFDIQGFFMSIHKPTLWNMLELFIRNKYTANDIETLLYLVKKVIFNRPQENCIVKGSKDLWGRLEKTKSLFTCPSDCGMPIGNLTSQCFANFYLSYFDRALKEAFGYYGRYVDDFYIISENKSDLLSRVPKIQKYLHDKLFVRLHPFKRYIQHYSRGIKFIGGVVKGARVYISNGTITNIYNTIYKYNRYLNDYDAFFRSLNSYFGFLKHSRSYNIKKRLCKKLDEKWQEYFLPSQTLSKFKMPAQFKQNHILIENMKSDINTYF